MRWALWIFGSLAAIIAIVALIGALLPRDHVATRSAQFSEPPAAVWQAITNYDDFPKWRCGVLHVERLPDRDGHPVWLERGKHDAIPYEALEAVAPDGEAPGRLVVKIADPKLPFGGSWTYEVAANGGGTRLRITERGEVYNPIFRFVSRFVIGETKTMDDYLTALGRKYGETIRIGG
ncbi:MAG TPA: SRPBCC family protein [Candidatus Acidoferrales bacterium]|nr:SRPBCC family protein [Candidatus Acidoferrales bacterium]